MIRNPKYKGCYAGRRYASRDYRDKRSYRLSEDKWLVHEDDRVPASCGATWDKANRLLGRTRTDHEAARARHRRTAMPTAASSSARSTAQLSTGMCIKAKGLRRDGMLELQAVPRKGKTGRLRLPHDLQP